MNDNDIGITLSADDKALLQVLRNAGADIQAFAKQGGNSLRDLQDAARGNATALEQLAGGMKTAFIGGGIAASIITIKNAVEGVTMSMLDAQMQADKVKNSLAFAMGGPQAAQEIQYLRQVTDQLGVSFANVAPMYGRLAAATKGTNLEGRATREIFESIAQASVVMGLGVEETEGAMRALVQMVSKGQIQAEELRGQLGERLPRAFQLFAESMGVSTGELSKLLETGKVGTERLAQFAATLKGELAGNVDEATNRLAASVNRLDNAWLRLKQNIGESGVSSFMSGQMAILADVTADVADSMEKARAGGDGFAGQMLSAGGAVLQFMNPLNAISYSVQSQAAKLKEAELQLKEYEALLAKEPSFTFLNFHIEQLKQTIALLKAANDEKNKFAASGPSHRQMEDASMAKWAEQQAQQLKDLADIKGKLNHVDKDYLPTLQKLNDAWKSGALTQTEYVDLVSKLAAENYKAEKSTASHADAFGDFIKKVNEKLAAQAQELDSGHKLTESDKLRIQFNEELGTKYKKLTAAQLAQVDALLKALKAMEEQERATKRLKAEYQAFVEFQDEVNAGYVAESKAREQGRLAVDAYIKSIGESNDQIALEQSLFGQTQRNRDIALEQYRIELDLKKQIDAINSNPGFNQSQRADEIARATAAAQTAKAAALAKADMVELQRLFDSFDNTAHDVFVNIFNDGSNAFKKLGQSLKAGLIDVLYQLTLKRWIINIAANMTGSNTSAMAGLNGASTGIDLLSNGSSLFNSATALGGLFGSTAAYAGAIGGGSMAAGSQAAMLAAQTGVFGAEGLAMTASAAGGLSGAAASVLQPLIAAAPYLAAVAGVIMLAKSLDHSGTPHTGGGAMYSAAGGLQTQGQANGWSGGGAYLTDFGGYKVSADATQMQSQLVQSIVGILDSTATTFGKTAGYTAAAAFADDSSSDGSWGALVIQQLDKKIVEWGQWANGPGGTTFSDGSAGSAEYLARVSADVRKALDGIGLPAWATQMLNNLGDAPTLEQLAATVAEINKTQAALQRMGQSLVGFSSLSDAAVQALIAAAGGIDALATAASTYYDNFYTEAEKQANTLSQVGDALGAVGLALPTTREGFRALVEQQQALGEAGVPAVAALLKNAGAFASVVPAAAAASDAVDDLSRSLQDIARERADLQQQYDLLAGLTTEAEIARNAIHESNLDLYDKVQTLKEQKAAADAAAEAAQALKEAEKALAAERAGLMDQLWQATGNTAAIRAKQLAGLDPSNRSIQQALYDIADAQTAYGQLQTSVQAEKDRLAKQFADDKAALQEQAAADYGYLQDALSAAKDAAKTELDLKRQAYADQISAAQDAQSQIADIASALASAMKSVQIESEAYDLARLRSARALIAGAAASGNIKAAGLGDALGIAAQDSKQFYSTFEAYAFDQAKTAADIAQLNNSAQSQLSGFDQTIESLKAQDALAQTLADAQIAALQAQYQLDLANAQAAAALQGDGFAAQLAALQAQYDQDVAALDKTLADAQKQLDALQGIDNSVKSVATALDSYTAAILAAMDSVALAAAADAAVITAGAIGTAMSSSSAAMAGTYTGPAPVQAGMYGFAVGTNYVPYDMVAQIHQGEAIVPRAYNPAADGRNVNAELVAEVRALRAELAAQNRAIAENTMETTKTLKRWNGDGMPEVRTV